MEQEAEEYPGINVHLSLLISISLSIQLSLSLSRSPSISISLDLDFDIDLYFYISVYLPLPPLSRAPSLSICIHLSIWLPLSLFLLSFISRGKLGGAEVIGCQLVSFNLIRKTLRPNPANHQPRMEQVAEEYPGINVHHAIGVCPSPPKP